MNKNKFTFTKIIVIIYSIFFVIWVSLSYVLAFLDRFEIAQELSSQVVIVGIASILGYMCKAFFETREEEKNKLQRDLYVSDMEDIFSTDEEDIEEAVE